MRNRTPIRENRLNIFVLFPLSLSLLALFFCRNTKPIKFRYDMSSIQIDNIQKNMKLYFGRVCRMCVCVCVAQYVVKLSKMENVSISHSMFIMSEQFFEEKKREKQNILYVIISSAAFLIYARATCTHFQIQFPIILAGLMLVFGRRSTEPKSQLSMSIPC